jgi:Transmembrane family, TMEM144 of transporters
MTDVCEACGWMAAIASMLAFGSFAAPIKCLVVSSLDVDPLVFQSYKTLICFLTSWVVLFFGQNFTYSPWGIVSGFFWVPGGVATIFAVKSAGMAVGVGVGSSIIVLVSFIWGIFIFDEHVRSTAGACFAVALMVGGVVGMSAFSAPEALPQEYSLSRTHEFGEDTEINEAISDSSSLPVDHDNCINASHAAKGERSSNDQFDDNETLNHDANTDVVLLGRKVRRRTLGILAAGFNGTWGGSIMVPMHWSG